MATDDQLRNAMAKAMQGFAAVVQAIEPHHWDRASPCAEWSAWQVVDVAAPALDAFGGSLDRTVEHRVGTITARRMLGFRIIDELGHTWEVVTATDQPSNLDPNALTVGVEIAMAERKTLEQSPHFATSPEDGQTASGDPLAMFLQVIGRVNPDH